MSDKALRSAVIKLAHSNPDLRVHLLPLLKEAMVAKTAMEFATSGARSAYLRAHPKADKSKHTVAKDTHSHAANKAQEMRKLQEASNKDAKENSLGRRKHLHLMLMADAAAQAYEKASTDPDKHVENMATGAQLEHQYHMEKHKHRGEHAESKAHGNAAIAYTKASSPNLKADNPDLLKAHALGGHAHGLSDAKAIP